MGSNILCPDLSLSALSALPASVLPAKASSRSPGHVPRSEHRAPAHLRGVTQRLESLGTGLALSCLGILTPPFSKVKMCAPR